MSEYKLYGQVARYILENKDNHKEEYRNIIRRFLNRATFGYSEDTVTQVEESDFQKWLEDQKYVDKTLISEKAHLFTELYCHHKDSKMKEKICKTVDQASFDGLLWQAALESPDQLRQRVAYAMSQIFVVSRQGINRGRPVLYRFLAGYHDMLVEHCLGSYRNLLSHVTLHPSMGEMLGLKSSSKANSNKGTFPDENYAREVMQLFSIGLVKLNMDGTVVTQEGVPEETYSQNDVEEMARALTGWRGAAYTVKNWNYKPMGGKQNLHDTGSKTILGTEIPAGGSPRADLEAVLDILSSHPNTAPFISKALIKMLVQSNPRPRFVEDIANVFVATDGDLFEVVSAILRHDDALLDIGPRYRKFGENDRFGKVKEPLICVTNACRGLGVTYAAEQKRFAGINMAGIGQSFYGSPTVFNFFEPDFAPKGEVSDKNLIAPEAELHGVVSMKRYENLCWKLVTLYERNFRKNKSPGWDIKPFARKLKADEEGNWLAEPLLDFIEQRLFMGSMSFSLKNRLARHIKTAHSLEEKIGRNVVVKEVLYLSLISPEFQTFEHEIVNWDLWKKESKDLIGLVKTGGEA
ncbi:hypothetical protein CS022_05030 [Veronia nyctiphanis]|uniref:Uncharacterized protein n=1 Tax=Veronia nyctiphanis TaxID=1278244 RepID=A0A4V1LT55_9GAMM|nr:DUF1800 family protein [Veronia nyctiphanis]RXJ74018.1 hypothetical protein CS022_05030 [Veronia nyctiphanis]